MHPLQKKKNNKKTTTTKTKKTKQKKNKTKKQPKQKQTKRERRPSGKLALMYAYIKMSTSIKELFKDLFRVSYNMV